MSFVLIMLITVIWGYFTDIKKGNVEIFLGRVLVTSIAYLAIANLM